MKLLEKTVFARLGVVILAAVFALLFTACPPEAEGGDEPGEVDLSFSLQLTEANWKQILTDIKNKGKNVNLDLSACTRSNEDSGGGLRSDGTFDPIYNFFDGKEKIISLTLPDNATSIIESESNPPFNTYGNSFGGFSNLKTINGKISEIRGDNAFWHCGALTNVNFPLVTTIGYNAFRACGLTSVSFPAATSLDGGIFFHCSRLTSVSLPVVTDIGGWAFEGCTSLTSITLGATAPRVGILFSDYLPSQTITVKVPSGATGYGTIPATYSGTDNTENWGNAFRGAGWNGTQFGLGGAKANSNITLKVEYLEE